MTVSMTVLVGPDGHYPAIAMVCDPMTNSYSVPEGSLPLTCHFSGERHIGEFFVVDIVSFDQIVEVHRLTQGKCGDQENYQTMSECVS